MALIARPGLPIKSLGWLCGAHRYVNAVASEATCGMQNVVVRNGPPDGLRVGVVQYVASTAIRTGDEILIDYGPGYWKPYDHPRPVLYECGVPALHVAAGRGDIEAASALLRTQPDLVKVTRQDARLHPSGGGWTALFEAAMSGHVTMVQLLLEHGADVNHAPAKGGTAMFWAVSQLPFF